MRAAVYRHVEGQNTIAGVSLTGFLALLAVALVAIQFLSFAPSLLTIASAYAALRIASSGKPPLYWQHFIVWHARRITSGGRLTAAARCHSPQFPFGPYASTDVRRSPA